MGKSPTSCIRIIGQRGKEKETTYGEGNFKYRYTAKTGGSTDKSGEGRKLSEKEGGGHHRQKNTVS